MCDMAVKLDLIECLTVKRNKGLFIWLCNIGAEKYWNRVNTGIVDRNEDILVNRVEEMNLLICRRQDYIILREYPDEEFLGMLARFGFSIPNILVPSDPDPLTPISELVLKDEGLIRKLASIARECDNVRLVPYAVTRLEEKIAGLAGLEIIGAPAGIGAGINDKIINRQIAEILGFPVCEGKICCSMEEVRDEYERLAGKGFERVIIKEPYGASGKGLYIVSDREKCGSVIARLTRFARGNPDARWLVEGWYEKQADLNGQVYISPSGEVKVFSVKQQLLNGTVYIGSRIPPDIGQDTLERYKEYCLAAARYLYGTGYTGVAGIDSIIAADGTIIPIIEINGRFTLSTYISFMQRITGEARLMTRYFKLLTDTPVSYRDICGLLAREGLLYDPGSREGIMVYTSGTLPTRCQDESRMYSGRLFALIASESWAKVREYSERLDGVAAGLAGHDKNIWGVA